MLRLNSYGMRKFENMKGSQDLNIYIWEENSETSVFEHNGIP